MDCIRVENVRGGREPRERCKLFSIAVFPYITSSDPLINDLHYSPPLFKPLT